MIRRILLSVNDSAASLAAARLAVDLAHSLGAQVRVITVAEGGRDPAPILRHVAALGDRAGVRVDTESLADGVAPYEHTLAAARAWPADLVVMGRSDQRRTGRPYVGSQTEHLLEFAEVPVLVVPERSWSRETAVRR